AYPFDPAIAVAVDGVVDRIIDMLHCHVSQFYEWLPYNFGVAKDLPRDEPGRKAWLGEIVRGRLRKQADRFRAVLTRDYGPDEGRRIEYAEAFEACGYGAPLDAGARRRLFPFVPTP